jgi:hypothetical protein
VAVERRPGAIKFMFRIKMQHHSCDFAPVATFRMRVEQAQLCDQVLLVVNGQHGIGGRYISDIGIKRRRLHGHSRANRLSSINLAWAPWHIDDPYPRSPLCSGGLNRSTQHFILKERWSVV